MKLPVKEAYEAYRSRDTSYDGVLFVGIKSTGIYCRPICPARRASAKNCDFFESAAEAEAAGYRPCLVCHPERPSFSASLLGTDSLAEKMGAYLWSHATPLFPLKEWQRVLAIQVATCAVPFGTVST